MHAILLRDMRDGNATLHRKGEPVCIERAFKRADFDERGLLRVRCTDGAALVVFAEEVSYPAEA